MSEAEIDAVMTLIPEAQYERIAAGTPCMSSDGRRFTVIGMTKIDGLSDSAMYNSKILMSFDQFLAKDRKFNVLGLYYDPLAPEQQEIIVEKFHKVRTLIDLDL